ncbi:MAG: hypothetical protein KC800_09705 [Candidatus Eremiobacteraeota bacterium]|nr:hypothetical protein [Candidatus Eremiobacteraeota bacterium]
MLAFYDRWMFRPGSARRLGMSRALFYLCYLWQLWSLHPIAFVNVSGRYWEPVPLMAWLPQPGLLQAQIVFATAFFFGVTSALGWRTRISTIMVALLGSYCLSWLNALGGINFHAMPLILISWILPFSACGSAFSLDSTGAEDPPDSPEFSWPIRVCWFPLLLPMASAGFHKVVGQWFARPDDMIESFLRFKYYVQSPGQVPSQTLDILPRRGLLKALAYLTVVLELGCPLALLDRPRVFRIFWIGGLFFMQMTLAYVLSTLETFPWMGAYVFWVPWEKVWPVRR